jgi:hypothetical protein
VVVQIMQTDHVDQDDAVEMIGHDNNGISFDMLVFACDLVPPSQDRFTGPVETQHFVDDVTEEATTLLNADCDEVRTRLRVVEIRDADRTAMVAFRVIRHRHGLS